MYGDEPMMDEERGSQPRSHRLLLAFVALLLTGLFALTPSTPRLGDLQQSASATLGALRAVKSSADRAGVLRDFAHETVAAGWRRSAPGTEPASKTAVTPSFPAAQSTDRRDILIDVSPRSIARGAQPRPYDPQGPPRSTIV